MKRILIVDDLPSNRNLLKRVMGALRSCKTYEVLEAENGERALEIFAEQQPDLVLLDINMPYMDGYAVAAAMKSKLVDNYVPIIFVTALSDEQGLSAALQAGGDDYISKPIDIGVLDSKIHAHLRIRELNQKLSQQYQQLKHEQGLIEHFFERALSKSYLDPRFINYHMSSMSAFNGDIFLSHKDAKGGLYLLVGDFTGHGLTAAMGTLPVAMMFFKMTEKGLALAEIINEINRQLHHLMPVSMFMAASLVYLDMSQRRLLLWKGGMPESYLMDDQSNIKQVLQSKNVPLGILSDQEFTVELQEYDVADNDRVYFFSDGITEARNPQSGEMFSHHISQALRSAQQNRRIEHVIREMKEFSGRREQADDITMVELICAAQASKSDGAA